MIDCPPSLGLLSLNAFAASDYLVIPLQCEYYALEGISTSHRVLGQVRDSGINPRLEILGVIMTMFDARTRLSAQVVSEVREHFGAAVFDTVIPRTTRLAEAPSFGKPIIHYDKSNAGAAAYEVLTNELIARVGKPQRQLKNSFFGGEARRQHGCRHAVNDFFVRRADRRQDSRQLRPRRVAFPCHKIIRATTAGTRPGIVTNSFLSKSNHCTCFNAG